MASPRRTGRPVRSETSAVVIVTPAEGPSFGIAPAGTWMWRSEVSQKSGAMPSGRVRAHPGERRLRRLLHDVAELAGQCQRALALHPRRLDEEDVAARRGPGEPDGHPRHPRALLQLL